MHLFQLQKRGVRGTYDPAARLEKPHVHVPSQQLAVPPLFDGAWRSARASQTQSELTAECELKDDPVANAFAV